MTGAPLEPPVARAQALARRLESIPLRVRLVGVLSALMAVALVATTAVTAVLMQRDLVSRVDSELRAAATPVANQVLSDIHDAPSATILSAYAVVYLPVDGSPEQIANPTGYSEHPAIPPLPLTDPRVVTGRPFTVGSTDGDLDWRVVARPTTDRSATVAVAVPLAGVEHTVHRLLLVTGLIGLAVLLALAALGWYLVRRAFRPLSQIEDTAAAIAAGDLTQRIPVRAADDEVQSLARSLNGMLTQIEESFALREASEERMRQFVSDASHELRTPLATVRGYAELYRQGAVADRDSLDAAMGRIEGEATRMGGLVDDLLTLARLDEEPHASVHPVDLTVLAADAVQDAKAQAPDRTVRLDVAPDGGPYIVEGTESRLRQVLANLVTNAIRHTPSGTPVEVALATDADGSHVVVKVIDHGNGVDAAIARKIFERFYRADKARSREHGGTGLGLAIVAAIVAGHDGRVGLATTPGGGATFVVEIPTAFSQTSHGAL
ncbi:Putative two component system response sensor kinase membrane associated phoS [Nostocoides japonicum T1-X7]|uniref:histidine kinase n=1 Tax=Nostocoides japonicum T1-X7 TaxID=1194083 RepID=A0A077LYM3_9MICO|nr:ATP-binding protein [Tetrasphaera japonica]CCH78007.1 Putative two component system response sensor kinase membrane associated phoS [Tetrasphaera japonica T1-X7]